MRVHVEQIAVDVLDKSGQKVDRTHADKGAFVATMSYNNNHWVIDELQTMAS